MEMGSLSITLKVGGFFEIDSGRGVVRVKLIRSSNTSATFYIEAPRNFDIARDKVLAKRAEMRRASLRTGLEDVGLEQEELEAIAEGIEI